MQIAAVLVLVTNVLLVESVILEIRKGIDPSSGASSATIFCAEEREDQYAVGRIRSMSVQTVTVITDNGGQNGLRYVMKPVVELSASGVKTWGRDYDYKQRSYLTGVVQPARSSITLTITPTSCKDNLAFVCVASGNQGTADSNQGTIIESKNFPEPPVIKGGRRCPGHHMEAYDRCDVYASGGENLQLRCKVKISLPAEWNTVRWFLRNSNTVYNVGNMSTAVETSSGSCQGNLTNTLSYKHVPWNSHDVNVLCQVEYRHSNTSVMMTKSAEITICTEEYTSQTHRLNEAEVAGVFIAGCVAMLIVILMLAMCVACCGNSIKVYKKNKMDVTRI